VNLLELDEIKQLPSDYEGIKSCIYFLWHGDELMYIGGTRNAADRMLRHAQVRRHGNRFQTLTVIPYDRATFLACDQNDVFELEPQYLQKFETPYNHMLVRNRQ
jgi:GIY-YIG catalytic domain-containing protein